MAQYRAGIEGTTVPGVIDRAASAGRDEALVFPDDRITYAALAERTRAVAGSLRALGVGPGDHVGYIMLNGVDIVALMVGIMRIGAVAVPVNARYKGEEIAYVVENSDMKVFVVGDYFLDAVAESMPVLNGLSTLHRVVGGDSDRPGFMSNAEFAAGQTNDEEIDELHAAVDPDAMAIILYTSGTTARPKGVMHSQASLLGASAGLAERLVLLPQDRWWSPLPLFHIAAIATAMAAFIAGCTLVHVGVFEPGLAVKQLEEERATLAFPAFETIWLAVLNHANFESADLSSLERIVNIGIPERLRAMQERIPWAVQVSATGSTESGGFLAIGVKEDSLEDRVNTNGHVLPGMEVRIIDIETGADIEPDQTGELLYRGATRLIGYYRDPEVTAERIDSNGWFHTGDIYRIDERGQITFIERLKDMLKVGGENVAAAEIEDFLARHEAVKIVQVVAAPDARYVEVPCAYVELNEGAAVTERELIDFCLGKVATFKVPRYVRFVEGWPMSGTKIRKVELRERIAGELNESGITEAPRITAG
ncbi:MAG: AMP-binding protein [bacterium]|nr:AMP-binding protein [bacterium]